MSSIIYANNLFKTYGNEVALNGINFEIQSGSILGLIGPNGAGKTTILKAILGLIPYQG